jgi:uncharacterized membrane protein YhhN
VTSIAWVLLATAGLFAVADWVAVARGSRPAEYVCKPATLALLVVAAVAVEPDSDAQRAWFVAALGLSLVGDVFLMLPTDRFVEGLASFLLAHVAYVVGLQLERDSTGLLVVGAAVALVATATIGRVILRHADAKLRGPVLAYMVAIGAMVASAIGTADGVAVAAAALFWVSDGLIAWNRFVQPFEGARLAIITTYHAAQAAFVLSLVR